MPIGNVRAPQQRTLLDVLPAWYTRKRGEEGIYAEPPFDLSGFIEDAAIGPLKLVGKVGKSIRAAAVKLKSGKILEGKTHHLALDQFKGKFDEVEDADGFVTDAGEYLTRKEAVRALPKGSVGKGTEDAADIVGEKVEQAYGKFLAGVGKKERSEAIGREILEEVTNPDEVAKKFWSKTYFKLPPETQKKFQDQLYSLTGQRPGDAIASLKGKSIYAKDWIEVSAHHLPTRTEYLEGGERGYTALMEAANRKFK